MNILAQLCLCNEKYYILKMQRNSFWNNMAILKHCQFYSHVGTKLKSSMNNKCFSLLGSIVRGNLHYLLL